MTRRYMTDMIADANTGVIIIELAPLGCPAQTSSATHLSTSPSSNGPLRRKRLARQPALLRHGRAQPAHLLLDELNIEYDEQEDYVVIKHAALFTSTLLSRLLAQPNVKLFNAVVVEDLVVKENRVAV
ncbi:hypothetical protein ZWY2020_046896 [Hordeum vulgare]|nr:hypothetical protein ZWY2020_046896 [Hordeum vulgare]